tara:strand:- start:27 stop:1490 length:1464 start_codon:yes stop_codon:yes gene_type:complete
MNTKTFNEAKLKFTEGIKFFNEENYELAEKNFLESLDLAPQRLSVISNLIKIYIVTKNIKKLNEILIKYKNLEKEKEILFGEAYNSFFKEDFDQSIKICNQIVNDNDSKYSTQDLLASNFKNKGNFLEAFKIYKNKLLEYKNDYKIYYNIGCLLFELGKVRQANYYFEKSKNLNPNFADITWRQSLCYLTLKDFKNGFLLYEDRWKRENHPNIKFNNIKTPNNISEIKDKKILIWDEQGLGDTINFSRFVIDILKFTKDVTFVVDKKLKDILSKLHTEIFVVDYQNLKEINYDFQIPTGSLPKLLNILTTDDIKFYKLSLPETKIKKKYIDNDKFNIGIAWCGNPNYPMDKYRSISFEKFNKLLQLKKFNFYKLSKTSKNSSPISEENSSNIFDFGDKSLFEISEIIRDLDLVISVDTSINHLAGILGTNSILLLNYNNDWRWFDDKSKNHWYPSVKIIKQTSFNSWDEVFENLIIEVEKMYKKKGQ